MPLGESQVKEPLVAEPAIKRLSPGDMLIAQRRISPALQKGETEVAQSVPGREHEPALSCWLCVHQPFGGMMKGEGKLGNPSWGGGGGRDHSNPEWGRTTGMVC